MRTRLLSALVATAVLSTALTACSGDDEPRITVPSIEATPVPSYDGSLEPSAAVLAVVPADATLVEVTDFAQLRLQLGFGVLTSASPPQDRAAFWRRADREAALLSRGALRDSGYREAYGFGQDDVSWEALFDGPSGTGYVVKFRDDLDMDGVEEAAAADDGVLSGGTVVASEHLVASGATRDTADSWAADPALVALAGLKAGSTYLSRECLSTQEAFGVASPADLAPTPAATLAELGELSAFSVSFTGVLATARLGAPRDDVFVRARLAERLPASNPDFGEGYGDGVADPSTGRIGFRLGDAKVAARLAQDRKLPFAVCGP